MPYALPTSPLPSPRTELSEAASHRKAFADLASHIEDVAGPSHLSGPMTGIPRRSSSTSNSSATSTPRRGLSPAVSRQPSGSHSQFAAAKPLEGLPRRQSHTQDTSPELAGLPSLVESLHGSTLGLKLHPSPIRERGSRTVKDSMDSTSTVESSLPPTPGDEHPELPLLKTNGATSPTAPIPDFQPPPKAIPHHLPRLSSPVRPSLHSSRRGSSSGGHHRGSAHHSSLQLELPVSASTTHLPQSPSVTSAGSATHLRPSHQTIRKKSGEIVRPSLKVRSMSTPDLTRQSHVSEPPTPDSESGRAFPEERSKSVRFANENDGEVALENVVVFSREQRPTAVGRAADPNGTAQVTETETENDTDASDFVQFRTRRNAAAKAADEVERIAMECGEGTRVPRVRTDFAPDARGSLMYEHVVLERADLSVQGQGPLTLRGSTIVRNMSFQKWVVIRFTLDQWQTTSEVSGVHVCHIPSSTTGDEGWDRFSFSIKLEDYKRKLDERTLMLCIRFSVDGREWWDSNGGANYKFVFKKQMPKRTTRAAYGTFARSSDDSDLPLPGLKSGRTSTSAAQIQKQFAKAAESPPATAAKQWTFPRLASQIHGHGTGSRSGSPAPSAAPSAAFKAPPAPDAHSHLSLSKYCAPSPPTSPPQGGQSLSSVFSDGHSTPKGSPATELAPAQVSPSVEKMNIMGGNYATPAPLTPPATEPERIMWTSQSGSFESFAQVLENLDAPTTPTTPKPIDGDSTPVALGARSPAVSSAGTDSPSPVVRSLAKRPSTGNLQALAAEGADLLTPPSSNLSSPPSPGPAGLPGSISPSVISSTGDSSPVTAARGSSANDLSKLDYQAFIDKFCFFQSPRSTPNELDGQFSRPSRISLSGSGYSSPHEFPFYTNSSNSPRATPTPTRDYRTSGEAFGFGGPNGASKGERGGSRPESRDSPMDSPRPQGSPNHPAQALKTLNGAYSSPALDHEWRNQIGTERKSPSLAAAK